MVLARRHSLDGVLRLQDVATGSWRDVRPMRPGLIQICAYLLSGDSRTGVDLTSLRIVLVADLLARVAELSGIQALTAHVGDIQDPGIPSGLVMDSLGIHPPAASAASAELLQTPWAGPADVYVVGPNESPEPGPPGISIAVGMARVSEADGEVGHAAELLSERDADPLTLRLALMSVSYPQPTDLTAGALMGARKTLDRWRHRVAEWAEFPSRPVPPRFKTMIGDRFDELASAPVIDLLDELARRDEVPAGAKFETFVFADRILGLDLVRAIGQPRR